MAINKAPIDLPKPAAVAEKNTGKEDPGVHQPGW